MEILKINDSILKLLKRESWSNREKWLKDNPGGKFLSTYVLNESIQVPKDWNAIAQKCSDNPNHQYYGVPAEEILIKWKTKADKGADRGIGLDLYITSKLKGEHVDISSVTDEVLLAKFQQFDKFHVNVLSKISNIKYVGSELWLNSYKHGLLVRLDALFTFGDDDNLLIFDWKNNQNIKTYSRDRYVEPFSHLQDCDINKFTFQVHVYKCILHEIFGKQKRIETRIVNVLSDTVNVLKENFPYDEELIAAVAQHARKFQANKAAQSNSDQSSNSTT